MKPVNDNKYKDDLNMDIGSLKKSWNDMRSEIDRVDTLDHMLIEKLRVSDAVSITSRLKRRFCCLSVLCFVSSFLAIPIDEIVGTGTEFAVCFALYFIVLGILNTIMLYKVCGIDLSIMTVKVALEKTVSLQITRFRFKRVGYAMMIPMLLAMLYIFCHNGMAMFYGGVGAAFFGCLAGYRLNRNIERHIHLLKDSLADELSASVR